MYISEEIQSMAPGHAVYYRLKLTTSDGSERVFPSDCAFYKVGESPYSVLNSRYVVYFYDGEYRPISHGDKTVCINLPTEAQPQGQLSLPLHTSSGSGTRLNLHARLAQTDAPNRSPQGAAAPASSSEPRLPDELELEFRRHHHALDLEERQQEFIKNSTYVTEVAELFTVNRLMRREMLELHRIIVQHSARAYQDIDHVKGTVHELLDLQKAVLEHAATQIVKAPAPPPDYVGLGHSALSVVKELGVALLQRAQAARDIGSTLRDPRPLQQLTAPKAEVGPPPPAAPSDALAKMIAKLQNMTELDLAMAMSSPDSWKALLDSLRASPESNDGAPAASTPPSAPNEEPSP